jgi:Cys-rich protein (TIGR01571 family)
MDGGKESTADLEAPLLDNIEPVPYVPPPTAPVEAPIANAIRVEESEEDVNENTNSASIPRGRWKDSLCSCCKHGCCHPSLICAWCFPSIAVAQVMKRLNLRMSGREGTNKQASRTFFIILLITVLFHLFSSNFLLQHVSSKNCDKWFIQIYPWLISIVPSLFTVFVICLIMRTRHHIRNRYNIPERNCVGCEDCCVSFFFPCCAVAQMSRHTADYDTYRALCCSNTGLPGGVPSIV